MRRAVFLDRDGTLIENISYLSDLSSVRLLPGSADGLRCLRHLGFFLVVVTNQSGVARGFFPESFVPEVHGRINELLLPEDAAVDAFYYCPHAPCDEKGNRHYQCDCRKPSPGMALMASEEWGIQLSSSWMIGDSLCDVEFALNCGCRFVLVRTGHGGETEKKVSDSPLFKGTEKSATMFFIADDFRTAALLIEKTETGSFE